MPAAAIVASAVIGAGASIYSGNKAAKAQEKATEDSLDTEWKMYTQSREDYAPWREAGEKALGTLEKKMEAGPGEFIPSEQPGYNFGFKNFIQDPYLSSQAAKGKRLSGETAKGLIGYAQDYASTQYDNFLARYYQSLTPYQSLSQVGQTSAAGSANAALQVGSSVSNIQYQNAINQGNIQTGISAGVTGAGQQGIQNYLNYKMYEKMGVK